MEGNYILKINTESGTLDDDIILATNEDGEELLRFEVNWSGQPIRVRYPRHGVWDSYCKDIALLLRKMSSAADDVNLPDLYKDVGHIEEIEHGRQLISKKRWQDWALLQAAVINQKAIAKDVERIFFEYLRPEIEGKTDEQSAIILRETAPLDALVRMFCALLVPDQMLKKNTKFLVSQIFPTWINPNYTEAYTKKGDSQKEQLTNAASFV